MGAVPGLEYVQSRCLVVLGPGFLSCGNDLPQRSWVLPLQMGLVNCMGAGSNTLVDGWGVSVFVWPAGV